MIKVKLETLIVSRVAFGMLPKLPAGASFRVSKLITEVDENMKEHDKTLKEIQEKYGANKDDKGKMKFTPENEKLADAEYQDLKNQDVEINQSPVSIASLTPEGRPEVEIEPQVLAALSWMFTD